MPGAADPPADARKNAAIAHLSAAAGLVIPFGTVLGPLVAWILLGDEHEFVDRQARHAVDVNLAFLVLEGVLFAVLLSAFLMGLFGRFAVLGAIPLLALVGLVHAAVVVYATLRANDGADVRIPFRLPILGP